MTKKKRIFDKFLFYYFVLQNPDLDINIIYVITYYFRFSD